MKISTRTRYGTRMMVELAINFSHGPMFLRDIARKEEISEKYLSQIIIPLKAGGLVKSFRGAHGGYMLARSPEEITVKDIIEVLEGGFDLIGCLDGKDSCGRVALCSTRTLWEDLSRTIQTKLDSVRLSDLVKRCKKIRQNLVMYNI